MLIRVSEEKAFTVLKHRVQYEGHAFDVYLPSTDTGLLDEILGKEDSYHIRHCVPEGSDVYDLGANVGIFSLACAARGCRVVAVEASPLTYGLCAINLNPFPKVAVRNEVVSANQDFTVFATNLAFFAGSNIDYPECMGAPVLTRVKPFVEPNWSAFPYPQGKRVLKIDIEGAELGLFNSNARFVYGADIILMEWHNYDGHIYREDLQAVGYEVVLAGCGDPQPAYDKTFARGMLYAVRHGSGTK
jgi:FkbM family methyltransferase